MDADVVIVGAGAAGLAAAQHLATKSFNVVVVEARDHIGGRVWSQVTNGDIIELGAEFIHGSAPQTMKLLRETGEAAVESGGESWVCAADGRLRTEPEDFVELAARAFRRVQLLETDRTAEDLLRSLEVVEGAAKMAEAARAFVEGFEAADPARASAKGIAAELASGVDTKTSRPIHGYQQMFAHLQRQCETAGVQILLSSAVSRIEWGHGPTTIFRGESKALPLRTRAAIVTVPAGVLRHRGSQGLTFVPQLPQLKQQALEHIEMGHATKVGLRFKTRFWERLHGGRFREASFFRCQQQRFTAFWTGLPVRGNHVIAWAGGPLSTALRSHSKAELIDLALTEFGQLIGDSQLTRQEFDAGLTHDWNNDPFAFGAYSYLTIGGEGARAELAAPLDDTLFFAGEATSTDGQGGTVNGALETGLRAAREVAKALGTVIEDDE